MHCTVICDTDENSYKHLWCTCSCNTTLGVRWVIDGTVYHAIILTIINNNICNWPLVAFQLCSVILSQQEVCRSQEMSQSQPLRARSHSLRGRGFWRTILSLRGYNKLRSFAALISRITETCRSWKLETIWKYWLILLWCLDQ